MAAGGKGHVAPGYHLTGRCRLVLVQPHQTGTTVPDRDRRDVHWLQTPTPVLRRIHARRIKCLDRRWHAGGDTRRIGATLPAFAGTLLS